MDSGNLAFLACRKSQPTAGLPLGIDAALGADEAARDVLMFSSHPWPMPAWPETTPLRRTQASLARRSHLGRATVPPEQPVTPVALVVTIV